MQRQLRRQVARDRARTAAFLAALVGAGLLVAGCRTPPQPPANAAAVPRRAAGDIPPAVLKEARDLGYKPEKFKGNTVFCRREVVLGSRFLVKRCLDPMDLQMFIERQFQAQQQIMELTPCVGKPPTCGVSKQN
jgi:hypothetical protein